MAWVRVQGTALLTVDQRRWMDLKGRVKLVQPLRTPPRPEDSKFRSYVFDITQNKLFKKLSAVLVLLNCALLYKPWKPNEQITQISALISSLFTFLFLVEAVMKCIGLGLVGYMQSRRNCFDLLVTILGIAWIILNFISIGKNDFVSATDRHIGIDLRLFVSSARVQQHLRIHGDHPSILHYCWQTRERYLSKSALSTPPVFSPRQR